MLGIVDHLFLDGKINGTQYVRFTIMDRVVAGLGKDLYGLSNNIDNPLILGVATILLLVLVILFLYWTDLRDTFSKIMGALVLVIVLTLAFNKPSVPARAPEDDPTVDSSDGFGSAIANYLLTVARFLVLLMLFYYVLKLAGLIIEAMQKHMVDEAYWAKIYSWFPFWILCGIAYKIIPVHLLISKIDPNDQEEVNKLAAASLPRIAFIKERVEKKKAENDEKYIKNAIIETSLSKFNKKLKDHAKALGDLLMLRKKGANENKNETEKESYNPIGIERSIALCDDTQYVAKNTANSKFIKMCQERNESNKKIAEDVENTKLMGALNNASKVANIQDDQLEDALKALNENFKSDLDMFIYRNEQYQQWINNIATSFGKQMHVFFGLMDVTNTRTWPVHGIAFVSGLIAVLVVYFLGNCTGQAYEVDVVVGYTNRFAFAAVLTVYLLNYLLSEYMK
jgi:hypothetical protein